MTERTVYCEDALPWLAERRGSLWAVVTSLPDAAELAALDGAREDMAAWDTWFNEAARACMGAVLVGGTAVFYQTDRRKDGAWHSKFAMLYAAAEASGMTLRWHKVVLRHAPGVVDLRRPGYAHLVAFGKTYGPVTPDVLGVGPVLYPNGMPVGATGIAVDACAPGETIVDPFCGRGTVLAVANGRGRDAIGLDIDPAQVDAARTVQIIA